MSICIIKFCIFGPKIFDKMIFLQFFDSKKLECAIVSSCDDATGL